MKKLLIIAIFLFVLLPTAAAFAADDDTPADGGGGQTVTSCSGDKCANINNPLGKKIDSPQKLIGQIINSILGIVGSLALLMFIWGGFQWMTAAGNEDKISKGKSTLTWAAFGLVVIFSSYALVSYLIKNVIKGG